MSSVADRRIAMEVCVESRPENVALARQAAAGAARDLGASDDLVDDVRTAVSEAVSNCVLHAYPEGTGPIEVELAELGDQLEIRVRDRGVGIQPRPTDPDEPSLRVGLALIGTLSRGVRIESRQGEGTEVAIVFDIGEAPEPNGNGSLPAESPEETRLLVGPARPSPAAIARTLELIAARSNLSVDRLGDVQLIADFLSDWNASVAYDGDPLRFGIREGEGTFELRIGPLQPGVAEQMLERAKIEGGGSALESAADSHSVEREELEEGPAEWLTLTIAAGG